MGSSDLDGRRFKPNISADRNIWRMIPTAAVTVDKVVVPNGESSGYITCVTATNASAPTRSANLFLAKNTVVTADANTAALKAVEVGLISNVDTSGASAGDPVYLSTAGGFTFSRPTSAVARTIGTVLVSSASVGMILFDGRPGGQGFGSNIAFGTIIIENGTALGTLTVGTAWNGAIVLATLNEAEAAEGVSSAVVATGDLQVATIGNVAADRTCGFLMYKGTADFTDA